MARGFYSVVQYCPDPFRAEAVNVGLVLLSVDPHALCVKMIGNHERVRKLFAISKPDLKNLKFSTDGLMSRIENSADELRTSEDLASFAASRANDLLLTEPRLAKLTNFAEDFERLFSKLVESKANKVLAQPAKAISRSLNDELPKRLAETFGRLQRAHKMWTPGEIVVPVYKTKLDIPYAYRNGVVNLVKPHVFKASKGAEEQAATLALSGDLISQQPSDGERQRLIVVSTQETAKQAREVDEHIEPLFNRYNVRLIRPQMADAFAAEVEKSAH